MKEVRIQQNGWKIRMQPLLVCFILTISVSISNFTSAQTWSLKQCIDTALQNNLDLKQARISAQINATQLKDSKQNLLPTLNGGVSHGYNWGQTIDLFTNQFATQRVMFDNFYLSSSIVLFQGLRNYYTIKSNQLNLKESRLQREITTRNIKIDVTAAYLQVLLNKEIVKISKENKASTFQQLKRVKALKKANQATQNDLIEIKAQLAQDNYQLVKAKNDLHYSKMLLIQLLNIKKAEDSLQISNRLASSFLVNQDKQIKIENLPDVRQKELAILEQNYAIKEVKSQYYPSLILGGTIGSGYSGNDQYVDNNGNIQVTPFREQIENNLYQSLVLTLSIPIFNKNTIKNQVKIAKIKLKSLAIEKEKLVQGLHQKIEQITLNIGNLNAQQTALQTVYQSTKLNYHNFKIRFGNNDITFSELTKAKNKLFVSKSSLLQTKYKLKLYKLMLSYF